MALPTQTLPELQHAAHVFLQVPPELGVHGAHLARSERGRKQWGGEERGKVREACEEVWRGDGEVVGRGGWASDPVGEPAVRGDELRTGGERCRRWGLRGARRGMRVRGEGGRPVSMHVRTRAREKGVLTARNSPSPGYGSVP